MNDAPILYIEDEEDYQILVKRILGRAGLQVVTADTGAEGLEKLRQMRPSLLILDINLPDTDGYAICSQLRQDPAFLDLPILMLTVRRRPEEWLKGFSCGANDYISKPLNPPELVERVVNCLEGRAHDHTAEGSPEYHLVQAAATGNRNAFEVLVQQYRTRLVDNMIANGHSPAAADDIASTAFMKAFEHMDQFRGEAGFYTWLYRIAMNGAKAFYAKKNQVSIDALSEDKGDTELPRPLSTEDTTDEELMKAEHSGRALEALQRVEQPYRRMLELFFLKDRSYEEIAKAMDIPRGTVMSRLFRARQLLQEAWQAQNPARAQ